MVFSASQVCPRAGFRPGDAISRPESQVFLTSGRSACVGKYESRGRGPVVKGSSGLVKERKDLNVGRCMMRRRWKQQPEHESPHDWRLKDIVLECGVSEAEVPRYVEFARELSVTLHRVPWPDFGRSTKAVVAKWFNRGQSGHVLWLIGSALLRDRFGRREDWM